MSPKLAQHVARQLPARVGPELHEQGDVLRIVLVRFCALSAGETEVLDLLGRMLADADALVDEPFPRAPLAAARGLEADQGVLLAGQRHRLVVALHVVGQPHARAAGQAADVQMLQRDVGADDRHLLGGWSMFIFFSLAPGCALWGSPALRQSEMQKRNDADILKRSWSWSPCHLAPSACVAPPPASAGCRRLFLIGGKNSFAQRF